MEIYKELKTPASKEFKELLNSQLSKNKIEEGKIIEGKINKVTDKFIFLFIEGLKSEPVLDINEVKNIKIYANIEVGDKISIMSSVGIQTIIGNLPKQETFTINSIFDSGLSDFDKNIAFIYYV